MDNVVLIAGTSAAGVFLLLLCVVTLIAVRSWLPPPTTQEDKDLSATLESAVGPVIPPLLLSDVENDVTGVVAGALGTPAEKGDSGSALVVSDAILPVSGLRHACVVPAQGPSSTTGLMLSGDGSPRLGGLVFGSTRRLSSIAPVLQDGGISPSGEPVAMFFCRAVAASSSLLLAFSAALQVTSLHA